MGATTAWSCEATLVTMENMHGLQEGSLVPVNNILSTSVVRVNLWAKTIKIKTFRKVCRVGLQWNAKIGFSNFNPNESLNMTKKY